MSIKTKKMVRGVLVIGLVVLFLFAAAAFMIAVATVFS